MRRLKITHFTGLLIAGGLLIGASAPASAAIIAYQEHFEAGDGGWSPGTQSNERASGGTFSLKATGAVTDTDSGNVNIPIPDAQFESAVLSIFFSGGSSGDGFQLHVRTYNEDSTSNQFFSTLYGPISQSGFGERTLNLTNAFNAYAGGRLRTITVKGLNNNSTTPYYIDDVSVAYTLVPEPATLTLLGLGGAVMIGRRRTARDA